MYSFAIAYGEMFSEVSIFPRALTILDATSEVNNHNAFRHALEVRLLIDNFIERCTRIQWNQK